MTQVDWSQYILPHHKPGSSIHSHWRHKYIKYQITETLEEKLLDHQGCKCGICKIPFDEMICSEKTGQGSNPVTWECDHDPTFGRSPGTIKAVRGYLCWICNTRLAVFETMIREGKMNWDILRDGESEYIDNMKDYLDNPPVQFYINNYEGSLLNALS